MTVGGRVARVWSCWGMKIRIERRLVEKQSDADGMEWAEVPFEQSDTFDKMVRVQNWNERFFEVIATEVVVEEGDVLPMFEDVAFEWPDGWEGTD